MDIEDQTPLETEVEAVDTPSTADIDAYSEFTFQGEKYTPETLADMLKGYKEMQSVQSGYNQEAKYYHNLDMDLKAVRENPQFADKFKSIYPQKFHTYLDYVLKQDAKGESTPQQSMALPKEIQAKIDRMEQQLNKYEQGTYESQVQAAQLEIDQTLSTLKTKYPNLDDEVVLAKAEVLAQKGDKITQGVWERLAKQSHESFTKRAELHHKNQLKQQLQKGQKGADMGVGGSVPQEGPRKPMSFDQALENTLASLRRS